MNFFRILTLSLIALILEAENQEAWQIAEKAFPSTALIVIEDNYGQPISLGSGFFVDSNIVVTNVHVIAEGTSGYAKIVNSKIKYNIAGTVGYDLSHDIVLLKLENVNAPKLTIGDSRKVVVGEEVYVVGNPHGLEGTFSQGIISGIREVDSRTLFQTTAPISPGSSGGPVFNNRGELIGVAFATYKEGQNLNFAIPAEYLITLLSDLKPLNSIAVLSKQKGRSKISDDIGKRSIEGVVGDKFMWDNGLWENGAYTFTLINKLRDAVVDVYCLVIFYDAAHKPIDFDVVYHESIILGGLGKRVRGVVDGSIKRMTTQVAPDNQYMAFLVPATRIEYRILDFKLAE